MNILIVGGYGEVGSRVAAELADAHPGAVLAGGRHPELARDVPARRIDVDDAASVDAALDGVGVVVACVRQREPHLLRAAVRRGIAYTSIAPPWLPWEALEPLHTEARRTGARVVYAAGLEPGISSVLARVGADRLGSVAAVETALLLSVGDAYGSDSLAFIVEELAQDYSIVVDGRPERARAFARSTRVAFPAPIGPRRAYTMPFRDQLYYPRTLCATTAVARIALDPPWVGDLVAALVRLGARSWLRRRGALHGLTHRLRTRYAGHDRFALVVDVRGEGRVVRSSLVGREQARATAVATAAIAKALSAGEVSEAGVWLAEQVIAPAPFLARLAARGLVPVTEELRRPASDSVGVAS